MKIYFPISSALGKTSLCQNTYSTYKTLQHACFNCTYYTCSYVKWVWDMSKYNKTTCIILNQMLEKLPVLSIFQILAVHLHFWTVLVRWYPFCVRYMQTQVCGERWIISSHQSTKRFLSAQEVDSVVIHGTGFDTSCKLFVRKCEVR